MDRYLIKYFMAVAELGNFSRAATKVNVTQPTLSAGIVKLEGITGKRLFDRDKRRVLLTPAGSRFLPHARRIAHEYEAALAEMSQAPTQQRLRLGVLSTISTTVLETALLMHMQSGSGEQVEIIEGNERDLRNRLEEGRLDAALTIVAAGSERFEYEGLGWEDYVLIVPRTHRLAPMAVIKGEDLAEDVMIVRRHCEALASTSRYFTQRGVRPHFGLKTTNDDRALALVGVGLGITVMPESFYSSFTKQIALADFGLRRQIGLIYAERKRGTASMESPFVAALRASFLRLRDRRPK